MARRIVIPRRTVVLSIVLAVALAGAGSSAAAQLPDDLPYCQGSWATIVGTDGDDVLIGTSGQDVIVAGGGNDVISARGGDDVICGGDGNDTIYGAVGDDIISGGPGDDRIFGRAGQDWMQGGSGNDLVNGGGGDDWANGGEGDDTLYGRGGNDQLAGVDGQDWIRGGPGNDIIVGGVDEDSTRGGPGDDSCEISPEEPTSACESVTAMTYHRASVVTLLSNRDPAEVLGPEHFANGIVTVYSIAFPRIPVSTRSADTTSFEVSVPDGDGEIRYRSEIADEQTGISGTAEFEANAPGPFPLNVGMYTYDPAALVPGG